MSAVKMLLTNYRWKTNRIFGSKVRRWKMLKVEEIRCRPWRMIATDINDQILTFRMEYFFIYMSYFCHISLIINLKIFVFSVLDPFSPVSCLPFCNFFHLLVSLHPTNSLSIYFCTFLQFLQINSTRSFCTDPGMLPIVCQGLASGLGLTITMILSTLDRCPLPSTC